jgi:hypothetical protein
MDASLELQGKLFAALTAAGIAGGRVYDHVPPDVAFPYVSFGPWTSTSDDADCISADEITGQIDVWSRQPGFVEAKQIARAVRDVLRDADLTLASNALVLLEHRITRNMREADGLTSRSAITFTALIEEP